MAIDSRILVSSAISVEFGLKVTFRSARSKTRLPSRSSSSISFSFISATCVDL